MFSGNQNAYDVYSGAMETTVIVGSIACGTYIRPNAENLKMSQTVQNHINDIVQKGPNAGQLSRPYIDSDGTTLLMQEIMKVATPVPDAILQSGLRWDVAGSFRGSTGTWELVVDMATNTVFDCTPYTNVDINIAIAYLNLGVDSIDMCVKSLWGFSPRESWKEVDLFVPSAIEGELRLVGEYEAGLTWRIDEKKMWKSYFDKKSGWYCIGNSMFEDEDTAVKVINNMIVVVDNTSELKAVWIQPIFV